MADIGKAKRNVARMIDGGASEQEIDAYLSTEGLRAQDLKTQKYKNPWENFTEPMSAAVGNIADKIKNNPTKGGAGDILALATSPIVGLQNVITKPIATALTNASLHPTSYGSVGDQAKQLIKGQVPKSRQLYGDEATNQTNSELQSALGLLMPAKGPVGRLGPMIPQKQIQRLTAAQKAVKRLTRGQNAVESAKRAKEFEAAGITDYTPLDIVDEASHGRVAAAAARQTPSRQIVQTAVDQSRRNFPGRMSKQVERTIHATPQPLEPTIDVLKTLRDDTADVKFAGPYSEELAVPEEVIGALKSNSGRAAIDDAFAVANERMGDSANAQGLRTLQEAMRDSIPVPRPRTTTARVELPGGVDHPYYPQTPTSEVVSNTRVGTGRQNLGGDNYLNTLSEPVTTRPVRASVLDRIQRAMRIKAENLMKGDNANPSMAGAIRDRRRVLNNFLDNVDGLGEARAAYRSQSQVIDATKEAPNVLKLGSDQKTRDVTQGLTDLELDPARQVLANKLQEQLGQGIGSAPGVAERFMAPTVKERIGAFAGPERAEHLSEASRLELERLRNLQQVSPRRFGAQSSIAEQDNITEAAHNIVDTAGLVSGHPVASVVSGLRLWARGLGMSDKEAELVARIAVDPGESQNVLRAMTAKYGPYKALQITKQAQAIAASNAASMTKQDDQ